MVVVNLEMASMKEALRRDVDTQWIPANARAASRVSGAWCLVPGAVPSGFMGKKMAFEFPVLGSNGWPRSAHAKHTELVGVGIVEVASVEALATRAGQAIVGGAEFATAQRPDVFLKQSLCTSVRLFRARVYKVVSDAPNVKPWSPSHMSAFPPKIKTRVLDETLEYVVAGRGSPAVLLVNGSGGPIEAWQEVFEPIARLTTVVAYNRPGIGASSRPEHAQTASRMVASLQALLVVANVCGPYVLVGHSLGGLIVNLFARTRPDAVAAVVLLDATAPDDVSVLVRYETPLQRFLKRLINTISPLDPNSETNHVTATVAELQAAPAFPAIPLTVVTGGKPAMAWATAREATAARSLHQRELAKLSPLGTQVIATRSGHFPQFTQPALVIDAVRQAILDVQGRTVAQQPVSQ